MKTDDEENYMNYNQDFETVNLILASNSETRGVDAFTLSWIKAEKQMRRVFTFLIFQNPNYNKDSLFDLRRTLAENKNIYFRHFIKGINLILSKQIKDIYGDNYDEDIIKILSFAKDRDKIFHGQITASGLTRDDLLKRVDHIKRWCKKLDDKLSSEIGYNGFSNSFCKSTIDLTINNLEEYETIAKYKAFLTKITTKSK